MPLASVLFVYCLTTIVLVTVRNLVCRLFSNEQRRNICHEFFCSLLWCIWCLELRILRDHYLIQSLIMYAFLCVRQFVCTGAFINPCGILADQMTKTKPMMQSVILVLTEALATVCALLYSLGLCTVLAVNNLSEDHATFYSATHYMSPLTVNPAWGFVVELGCTFVLCSTDALFDPPFDALFSSTIYMILYFLLGHFTGAFINPLTSLAFTVGREGEDVIKLIFVYALGPLMGTAMAMMLLPGKSTV